MTDVDLDNLIALQAAAFGLSKVEAIDSVVDRSNAIQRIGAEVEERALRLLAEVREIRGVAPTPMIAVETAPPPEPDDGKLTGAKVRDVMRRFASGFTDSELLAEFPDHDPKEVKRFIGIWMSSGQVRDTGFKIGHKKVYEYVKPDPAPAPRPTRAPPEKDRPAYSEARATGQPVRVAAVEKITRRGRSTPGVRHRAIQQDKRYERQQQAVESRAQQQMRKEMEARMNGGKPPESQRVQELRQQNAAAANAAKVKKKK